jgi:hypothetical protein
VFAIRAPEYGVYPDVSVELCVLRIADEEYENDIDVFCYELW